MNARLLPLCLILAPAMAAAQRGPDGYHCTAETFTNIGAIHGVGYGEVQLSADPQHRPTGTSYSYRIRDRVTGHGRMIATWQLPDGKFEAPAIASIWLPFHRELPQMPATIDISLDEGPPRSIPITDPGTIQVGSRGLANGLDLLGKTGTAPELRGRRSVGFTVKAADGSVLFQDLFLLPPWKKVPGAVASGLRRARADLGKKKCGAFYRVGIRPTAAGLRP